MKNKTNFFSKTADNPADTDAVLFIIISSGFAAARNAHKAGFPYLITAGNVGGFQRKNSYSGQF